HIWLNISVWIDAPTLLHPGTTGDGMVASQWECLASPRSGPRKGVRTNLMLVTSEIWKERNARVFNNVSTLPQVLIQQIKDEGRVSALAGAKHLASIS
ncbi:hypothetical protein BRADI_1g06633v3, partial [Brachypodium distachyon]